MPGSLGRQQKPVSRPAQHSAKVFGKERVAAGRPRCTIAARRHAAASVRYRVAALVGDVDVVAAWCAQVHDAAHSISGEARLPAEQHGVRSLHRQMW